MILRQGGSSRLVLLVIVVVVPVLLPLVLQLLCVRPVLSQQPQQEEQSRRLAVHEQIETLRRQAYSSPEGSPASVSSWKQVLSLDPKHLEAHVMLGWNLATSGDNSEHGFQLLEDSYDATKVSPTMDLSLPQAMLIAGFIGRYRAQHREYQKAWYFTEFALQLSKTQKQQQQQSMQQPHIQVCLQLQLATMFNGFPASIKEANDSLQAMIQYADDLLARTTPLEIDDAALISVPGAAQDPFVHCVLSLFDLSFYYQADTAAMAARHYELSRRAWPALNTTAPHVQRYEKQHHRQQKAHMDTTTNNNSTCVDRKIRLAVVSGALSEGHSVSEDFGGVLQRLDRNIFDVTYIYLFEKGSPLVASFTKQHPETDRVWTWTRDSNTDAENGAWTAKSWGPKLAAEEMDMILYLDLTMSTYSRRMGMQRLAPVQLNTHGHPVTSGIDRSVVQYFVSWAAAELPGYDVAQRHYTEELLLLPADQLHQYYERRILPRQVSRIDGEAFGHLSRKDFGLPDDENVHIYLCMQKPFKLHPEFDPIVCGILQKDPQGWAVMHEADNPSNQATLRGRLQHAGCDLERTVFLPAQPHHRLLALYRDATVVLDSYPAGGCTTTREVLELGKSLVTLPARLLGGRWTLGYYNNLGFQESTKEALVASTPEEYVELAVALGTNPVLRETVETDIRRCVPRLFHRQEAVQAWQDILVNASPVQQCSATPDRAHHSEL